MNMKPSFISTPSRKALLKPKRPVWVIIVAIFANAVVVFVCLLGVGLMATYIFLPIARFYMEGQFYLG